jgi:ribosome-binding ATPase YchF (GTP1/OBG family)
VILHVVRAFADSNEVQTGSGDSVEDYLTIETELQLADLATLEKQQEPRVKTDKAIQVRWDAIQKLRKALESGISASRVDDLTEDEEIASRELFLLTAKPAMFVLNTDEAGLSKSGDQIARFVEALRAKGIEVQENDCVVICAKLEEELALLEGAERLEYLQAAGLSRTGLETLIAAAYKKLGLLSFLTAGELVARDWTIPQGATAPEAAGVIHTDFIKHFISAKVCHYNDFVELGGWKVAAEKGKVRTEGKTYIMQEGDVVEFMIGK